MPRDVSRRGSRRALERRKRCFLFLASGRIYRGGGPTLDGARCYSVNPFSPSPCVLGLRSFVGELLGSAAWDLTSHNSRPMIVVGFREYPHC